MFFAIATLLLAALFAFLVHRKTATSHSEPQDKDGSRARPHIGLTDTKAATRNLRQPTATATSVSSRPSEGGANADMMEGETTPKAVPVTPDAAPIPAFSLNESDDKALMPPPSLPSKLAAAPAASLMPPPRAPVPRLSPSAGLRVPTTGPLPNRGPSPNQPHKASNESVALAANTAGQRNKVQLTPGHSPLDWATLCRNSDLSGVPGLQRVTPSQLAFHHGRKGRDAWSSFRGKVYNITPYLPFHPGGKGELMRAAGKDGEKLFMEIHSWVNWENMMNACLVGIMVSEEAGEGLDEMD